MDIISLSEVKFEDSLSYNLGNYQDGAYLYEIVMLIDSSVDKENVQKRLDEIKTKLTEYPVSTKEISSYILGLKEYETYRKIFSEKLDQNRRIANNTYSAITCRKCKKNKVQCFTVQERGLDEPSTQYITCLNAECMAKYKQAE